MAAVSTRTPSAPIPLIVDLTGRRCLVVGGGPVATRRAEALLAAGATVRIVAPALTPALREAASSGRVEWRDRPHVDDDAVGCTLVVAATDDLEVNRAVAADAARHGALCNRADRAEEGDVVVPAAIHREQLTVAVSTAGASPGLAAIVRDEIEDRFGPEWGHLATLLGELQGPERPRRETVEGMIGAGVLEAFREGDTARAGAIARSVAGSVAP